MLYHHEHETASPTITLDDDARQAELADLRRTVATLREQLRHAQRLASVGTMASMVVHEFNNILTPVVNYAELAKKKPALIDKALRIAAANGQRATDICQSILGLSQQAQQGRSRYEVRAIVREALTAMARDPQRDFIDLELNIPEHLTIVVRKIELQQVLLNLLINARSAVLARPAPRRIRVAADAGGNAVRLAVADNGKGIAPDVLPRIFEPFFTTRGNEGGNGLGLAICRDIVQAMGGEISVDSEPDHGATFTLVLPQ